MDKSLTNQDLDIFKIKANVLRNPFIKQMAKPLTEYLHVLLRTPLHGRSQTNVHHRPPYSTIKSIKINQLVGKGKVVSISRGVLKSWLIQLYNSSQQHLSYQAGITSTR